MALVGPSMTACTWPWQGARDAGPSPPIGSSGRRSGMGRPTTSCFGWRTSPSPGRSVILLPAADILDRRLECGPSLQRAAAEVNYANDPWQAPRNAADSPPGLLRAGPSPFGIRGDGPRVRRSAGRRGALGPGLL